MRLAHLVRALALCAASAAALARGLAAQEDPAAGEPATDLLVQYGMTPDEVVEILSGRSLMLTDQQVALIEEAKQVARDFAASRESLAGLAGLEAPQYGESMEPGSPVAAAPVGDLRLDAILYLSKESWTAWINGEPVTPATMPAGFAIGAIGPTFVEIALDRGVGEAARRIVLQAGQIYVAATGEVVEADEVGGLAESAGTADGDTIDAPGDVSEVAADVAEPQDLALSPEQQENLQQLQQALTIVSGNASALGLTEDELAALQASLAENGGPGALTSEQQEQLMRVQQATGLGQ